MSQEPTPSHRKYRLAVLIHAAFITSLPVYVLVVELLKRTSVPFAIGNSGSGSFLSLRYGFYGVAVILILLLRRLPDWLWPAGGQGGSEADRMLRKSILTSALCEIPAVLGMVLALLTGLSRDFYYLSGLALILFFMYFPRSAQWRDGME